MPRKSDILKLPEEVLAYINQYLDEGKLNLDAITEIVNELIRDKYLDENEVSRSSLGRYAKKRRETFERQVEIMRQQKVQREEFFERFGDDGLDNAGRYAAEMLYSFIMQLQSALVSVQNLFDEGEVDYGSLDVLSKVIQRISSSIGNLEKSLSENKARVDAIKREAAEETRKEDAEKLKALGKQSGDGKQVLDAETIRRIREEVYGVYE